MVDETNTALPSPSKGKGVIAKAREWICSRPQWVKERLDWCNDNRAQLVILVLIALAASLIVRILFSSIHIGSPATESEALVRSSERLIQMVQWTLSTVLIIGGGLIGLNWYSNEHRYREDKAALEERFDRLERVSRASFTATMEDRLDIQKQILEVKFDLYRLTGQIASTMMLVDGKMPAGGYVDGALDAIRKPMTSSIIKERILEDVTTMFERENAATSFTFYLGFDRIPELADEADRQGFADPAARLRKRYRELRPPGRPQP